MLSSAESFEAIVLAMGRHSHVEKCRTGTSRSVTVYQLL